VPATLLSSFPFNSNNWSKKVQSCFPSLWGQKASIDYHICLFNFDPIFTSC
jgi:hypothetical protein